jgi:hypothetical protein
MLTNNWDRLAGLSRPVLVLIFSRHSYLSFKLQSDGTPCPGYARVKELALTDDQENAWHGNQAAHGTVACSPVSLRAKYSNARPGM